MHLRRWHFSTISWTRDSFDRLRNVVENDFARVTYTEAIDILSKHNDKFDYKVSWGCDLQTEHARDTSQSRFISALYLSQIIRRR